MHKENELMYLIGMNPEDPYDLGAEVEICIGADMKKYTITRSCCICIPANTPHGFYRIIKADMPWMFVQVQEANPRTEKFLWEYLTPEQKASISERLMAFWKDTGYDDLSPALNPLRWASGRKNCASLPALRRSALRSFRFRG